MNMMIPGRMPRFRWSAAAVLTVGQPASRYGPPRMVPNTLETRSRNLHQVCAKSPLPCVSMFCPLRIFGCQTFSRYLRSSADNVDLISVSSSRAKVKLHLDGINYAMNITSLRPKFIKYAEPIAAFFIRLGITPNQVSVLSLIFGFGCAIAFTQRCFLAGSLLLVISAILDLVDGNVARKNHTESKFGAVFDWVADKYVDAAVILAVGISGIPIISHLVDLPQVADFGIVGLALIGSLLNTFIKPVTYAEIGYTERIAGKIEDPLEGVGFFGRPETIIMLVLGGLTGYVWVAVLLIAVCTNLSAIQRMVYLYRRYSA